MNGGHLYYAGADSYYWSSTAALYTDTVEARAYYLNFSLGDKNLLYGPGNRWQGHPLRCPKTL